MLFYRIKLTNLPKIKLASAVATDKYWNIIDHRKNMLEIALVEGTQIHALFNGKEMFLSEKTIVVYAPDARWDLDVLNEEEMRSTTVIVEIEGLEVEQFDTNQVSETVFQEPDCLFLPIVYRQPELYTHAVGIFKRLINEYLESEPCNRFRCIGRWFELVSAISEAWYREEITSAKRKKPSNYYYKKAISYINLHFTEKISLRDVANELHITPNYLCVVFKRYSGETITDYINNKRVEKARELLYDDTMNVEAIAEAVGIKNVRYLRELFKKYYGINIKQCRRILQEVSLYVDKPKRLDEEE